MAAAIRLCASTARVGDERATGARARGSLALLVGARQDDGVDASRPGRAARARRRRAGCRGGGRARPRAACGRRRAACPVDGDVRRRDRARSRRGSTPPSGPGSGGASSAGAVAGEPLGRDRLGDDDPRRGPAAELVLEPRELVVEGRRARDPERARGQRQVVRAVRERQVEAPRLRPASASAGSPRDLDACLAERRRAAVAADRASPRSRAARAAASSARTRVRSPRPRGRAPASSRISGRKTSTCGEFVRSTQTRIESHSNGAAG